MRRAKFKTEITTKHFDIAKLHQMICAFLELIDDFTLMIDDENFVFKINKDREMKINGNYTPRSSQVESLVFSDYSTRDKIKDLLAKFPIAFNILNDEEN